MVIAITTSTIVLEEQVAFLAKAMESLSMNIKERDDQIASMMEKIESQTRNNQVAANQNKHQIS